VPTEMSEVRKVVRALILLAEGGHRPGGIVRIRRRSSAATIPDRPVSSSSGVHTSTSHAAQTGRCLPGGGCWHDPHSPLVLRAPLDGGRGVGGGTGRLARYQPRRRKRLQLRPEPVEHRFAGRGRPADPEFRRGGGRGRRRRLPVHERCHDQITPSTRRGHRSVGEGRRGARRRVGGQSLCGGRHRTDQPQRHRRVRPCHLGREVR